MISVVEVLLFASLIYIFFNVALVMIRNYKAHQFYKIYSPKLPVLPSPNIFHGHMLNVTFKDKNWQIIDDLHKKYGPTFGFYMCDQPWVSTKNIDLLKLIEMDKPHKHINRSKFGLPFKEFTDSIFQVDDDQWRRVRRAIAPALTNQKVKSDEASEDIEHIISQVADGLEHRMKQAEVLTGERSIILDVGDIFHRYTLAVIFLIAYKRNGLIDFKATTDKTLIGVLLDFHNLGKLRIQIVDYIVEATDINRVAHEQHKRIQRRLSMETGEPERPFSSLVKTKGYKRRLVDTIIDAFIEKKVKYDEFIGTMTFLLLAGYETTAGTITCLVWHLAKNQNIQDKLREAIKRDGIEAEYLAWCIRETVRWHPAVPLGTGRILGEDVEVNGLFLAKGTFVMPSTYSIHHDQEIWIDADEFKPERWQSQSDYHPAAFMGYGLGPRNCVGGKLAEHEIKLVMRYLLSTFRIFECPETPDTYEFSAPGLVYTILDNPIKVKLVDLYKRSET